MMLAGLYYYNRQMVESTENIRLIVSARAEGILLFRLKSEIEYYHLELEDPLVRIHSKARDISNFSKYVDSSAPNQVKSFRLPAENGLESFVVKFYADTQCSNLIKLIRAGDAFDLQDFKREKPRAIHYIPNLKPEVISQLFQTDWYKKEIGEKRTESYQELSEYAQLCDVFKTQVRGEISYTELEQMTVDQRESTESFKENKFKFIVRAQFVDQDKKVHEDFTFLQGLNEDNDSGFDINSTLYDAINYMCKLLSHLCLPSESFIRNILWGDREMLSFQAVFSNSPTDELQGNIYNNHYETEAVDIVDKRFIYIRFSKRFEVSAQKALLEAGKNFIEAVSLQKFCDLFGFFEMQIIEQLGDYGGLRQFDTSRTPKILTKLMNAEHELEAMSKISKLWKQHNKLATLLQENAAQMIQTNQNIYTRYILYQQAQARDQSQRESRGDNGSGLEELQNRFSKFILDKNHDELMYD